MSKSIYGKMNKQNNLRLFKETCELSKNVKIGDIKTYRTGFPIYIMNKPISSSLKVTVSNEKSLEFVQRHKDIANRIAVLDFANHTHIGGGCRRGDSGQEEDLCRMTSLYKNLSSSDASYYYDKYSGIDYLYISGVKVLKSSIPNGYGKNLEEPIDTNIIVNAAPLYPVKWLVPKFIQREIHLSRALDIMDIAYTNGCTTLVTGAFGCGAFHNNPDAVIEAWSIAISQYGSNFDHIHFAVYDEHNKLGLYNKFEVFEEIFG